MAPGPLLECKRNPSPPPAATADPPLCSGELGEGGAGTGAPVVCSGCFCRLILLSASPLDEKGAGEGEKGGHLRGRSLSRAS